MRGFLLGLALLLPSIAAQGNPPPDRPEASVSGPVIIVDRSNFMLRFYRDGELQLESKVILGKPGRETPAFETEIQHIVFNPYWNLSPMLARDILPKYSQIGIERRGYEFVEGWTTDAPVTNQDPMKCVFDETCRMRQKPGPANFLGRVKFSMPNDHDIYIHDTPARHLFARERRAFSSGCIRTEHPLKLAEAILGRPVSDLVSDGGRREVYLKETIPVIVR